MRTVFVCGSMSILKLSEEAKEVLSAFNTEDTNFIVGDCSGEDYLIQQYLASIDADVTVYFSGDKPRYKWDTTAKQLQVPVPKYIKGRGFYTCKDEQMCEDATNLIAIWDGESMGTLRNLQWFDKNKPNRTVIVHI